MCSVRNVSLVKSTKGFPKLDGFPEIKGFSKINPRDNWLISHVMYRWARCGGKEFSCTRAELAEYLMCDVQYVTYLFRKFSILFHRRYVHIGRGENRRTRMFILPNLLELCIAFGEDIYKTVGRSFVGFLKEKLKGIFEVLARRFSSPKKTQEDVLKTNKLGDVSVSDSASPYTESISPDGEVVDMENTIPTEEKKDEISAFAPALCGERASAISSGVVTPPKPVILKHNKPYAHVLAALNDRGKDANAPMNTLDRIKQMVRGKMSASDNNDAGYVPSDDVHPLRKLLNKKLHPS